jgi:hypothetical protein
MSFYIFWHLGVVLTPKKIESAHRQIDFIQIDSVWKNCKVLHFFELHFLDCEGMQWKAVMIYKWGMKRKEEKWLSGWDQKRYDLWWDKQRSPESRNSLPFHLWIYEKSFTPIRFSHFISTKLPQWYPHKSLMKASGGNNNGWASQTSPPTSFHLIFSSPLSSELKLSVPTGGNVVLQ